MKILIIIAAIELSQHRKIAGTIIGLVMSADVFAIALYDHMILFAMPYIGSSWNYLFGAVFVCIILSALGMWHCRSLENQ